MSQPAAAGIIKDAIERLAAEGATAELFDAAAAAFAKQHAILGPWHPGRRALDRLMHYVRHSRRELIRQHHTSVRPRGGRLWAARHSQRSGEHP